MASRLASTVRARGAGPISLEFTVTNLADVTLTLEWWEPFAHFTLEATAADGPLLITQPAWDRQVRSRTATLAAGESVRITTPIHLRFVSPGEKERGIEQHPTEWLLRHEPTDMTLRATLTLAGQRLEPCETSWRP